MQTLIILQNSIFVKNLDLFIHNVTGEVTAVSLLGVQYYIGFIVAYWRSNGRLR